MSEQPRGFYYADVVAVERLTVHMVRVRFGGEHLADYRTLGVPDECVGVYFPRAGELKPPPMTEVDGQWWFHGVADAPDGRNYTVRNVDSARGELTIDFFAHEGGVAATWALQATPGQTVLLSRPRSWYSPPADVEWLLLVADMTGLPALGRLVEQLPAGAQAHAIVEVLERGDIQSLESSADVTFDWRIGSGNGDSASVLDDAALAYPRPAGPGYVWFAGEASSSRRVRKYFRKELGYDITHFDIIGYWRADSEKWLEKYKQYLEEAIAVYNGVIESGRTEQEAGEAFDALLERVGL